MEQTTVEIWEHGRRVYSGKRQTLDLQQEAKMQMLGKVRDEHFGQCTSLHENYGLVPT